MVLQLITGGSGEITGEIVRLSTANLLHLGRPPELRPGIPVETTGRPVNALETLRVLLKTDISCFFAKLGFALDPVRHLRGEGVSSQKPSWRWLRCALDPIRRLEREVTSLQNLSYEMAVTLLLALRRLFIL